MKLFKAEVKFCKEIQPKYFKMGLLIDGIAAKPGQFFHFKCSNDNTFRLRRPFSLHRKLEDGFYPKDVTDILSKFTPTTR